MSTPADKEAFKIDQGPMKLSEIAKILLVCSNCCLLGEQGFRAVSGKRCSSIGASKCNEILGHSSSPDKIIPKRFDRYGAIDEPEN